MGTTTSVADGNLTTGEHTPLSAALDLKPFCGVDQCRPYLLQPFSVGNFTYATNGHIMVRVPRRADVPDKTKEFNQDKPLEGHEKAIYAPLTGSLPVMEMEDCDCFDGYEHDCPDCECVCEACDGDGKTYPHASTSIGGANFAARYVALLLTLPGIEVAAKHAFPDPLLFRFDGGIGALMPINGECATHIEMKATNSAPGTPVVNPPSNEAAVVQEGD